MDRYKELYDSLLKDDGLHMICRTFTGEWDLDKDRFIKIQKSMDNEFGIDGGEDE
jgi:hypothetical protein